MILETIKRAILITPEVPMTGNGQPRPDDDTHDDHSTLPPSPTSQSDFVTLAATDVTRSENPISIREKVRYFGDYELIKEIARGGMGVVYKARQLNLNRIVALKMILAGQFANSEDIQRFHTEAEAAAQLDHPGIVPIFEIGEHKGKHYYSMGYIEGSSLSQVIANGPMPPSRAADLMKQICHAMAYAHEKGVIHRDLKPSNILIDSNGNPKVTDFGLAKQLNGNSNLTETGRVIGTSSFMAPEQATGRIEAIGPTSDVYALGATLYFLLAGRPPFQALSMVETIRQVIEMEPVLQRIDRAVG